MRDEILDLLKKTRLPLAFLLGAVLLYSGGVKLADLDGFARVLDNYRLLPDSVVNVVAVMVASVEVAAGAALVAGFWWGLRQGGAVVAGVLFLVFGVLGAVALARGLDIACGCFSTAPDSAKLGWMTVARNAFLMVLAGAVVVGDGVIAEAAIESGAIENRE
jgi:putative oxidoreductase